MASRRAAEARRSEEHVARSTDRSQVAAARLGGRHWRLAWLLVGPGILAMLGENDGPSMISYAATGATYGVGFFLPFIVVTFAMAVICQEMAMRVGSVTQRGFGQLVLERYGPAWGWFGAVDLIFTNLVTLIAEFVSIRVGMAYFHLGEGVAVALGLLLVAVSLSGGRYRRWERVALGLAAFNGLFLVAAVGVKPKVDGLGHALVTFTPLPAGGVDTLLLLVASTIGATVTPWMIFFQQSASADKGMTPADIRHGRLDTLLGGALAAAFGCGALVTGAALVARSPSTHPSLAATNFPAALQATSGHMVGILFAFGLIEAGAVAILTISASTAYAAGECLGANPSFNSSPQRATLFYVCNIGIALLAGSIILIPGVPLVALALNANILATVLLPAALVLVIMLASDQELMGPWVNSRTNNAVAIAITGFVCISGSAYGIDSFLQAVGILPGGR